MIDQIIDFNKSFVAQKGYEKYLTDKYPDKKLAVLSCMDTRLTKLLPAALGLKNGDAKIIKSVFDTKLELKSLLFMAVTTIVAACGGQNIPSARKYVS